MTRLLYSLLIAGLLTVVLGCGGVDNSAVAPHDPVPPPSEPPQKAGANSTKLP